jgi:RNA polymerase sigma-70 factor (ECF subfamily)
MPTARERAVWQRGADEELVTRVLDGSEEAFQELYDRYLPRIFTFVARRVRDRADTEEAVQEIFVNLFASMRSFRGEAPFGAWVFGLARRTLAGRFKRRTLPTVPLDEEECNERAVRTAVRAEPSPLEMVEFRECVIRLERALAHELSDEQRHLFRLHHLEHRPIEEIARKLRKTEDAIKSHLYRARKVLLT